mgnify:CR=1 FL=1
MHEIQTARQRMVPRNACTSPAPAPHGEMTCADAKHLGPSPLSTPNSTSYRRTTSVVHSECHHLDHPDRFESYHFCNASYRKSNYSLTASAMSEPKTFHGSCHCKAIKFTVNLPNGLDDNGTCDCSHCAKRGIIWQFPEAGALELEGKTLRGYEFGAKSTTHQVCNTSFPIEPELIALTRSSAANVAHSFLDAPMIPKSKCPLMYARKP